MKHLVFIFAILALVFTSCQKEEILKSVETKDADTTSWNDDYQDGGTLPNGNGTISNDLVGTTWVLTKIVLDFATEYPNDTITFVSNNYYTVNNGAVRTYQLSNIPSSTNYVLTFNFFFPMGGSHYSGQVGQFFVEDGEINNIEFEDIQNANTIIRAWFVKL